MLAKNQINRNKIDNKAKFDNKNIDFMPFIQNKINEHMSVLKVQNHIKLFKIFKKNNINNRLLLFVIFKNSLNI